MRHEFAIRLRLATSATLLSLWGCAWLFDWPVVGNYNVLFLAALAIQWPDYQFRRYSRTFTLLYYTILILVAGAIVLAAFTQDDAEYRAVMHSPFFVVPARAIGFLSIVLSGTPSSMPSESKKVSAAG